MPIFSRKKQISVAVATAAILLGGLSACGKNETAASLVAEAKQFQAKGDNKAAVIQLKNAAVKSPEDASVRLALGEIYNVAVGGRMSLNDLYRALRDLVAARHPALATPAPRYEPFRAGDVRHSQADVSKARRLLGYAPACDVREGLEAAMPWYESRATTASPTALRAVGD